MGKAREYQRRQPEQSVLYQVVQGHLHDFLLRVEDQDRILPRFVRRELDDFLRCGLLVHGFCRVHCASCGRDELVAFSCKRRGFCPSCGARRMADLAAHLVDRVWPDVPVRQWVLTLPHRVRFLCAYDKAVCSAVRKILVRAVSGFYLRDARRAGLPRAKAGAVVHQQRFDSAIRLNVHFHSLWADGAFANAPGSLRATFHPHGDVTDRDVANLLRTIAARVRRWLCKHGKLQQDDAPDHDPGAEEPDLLQTLSAAAIQGRTAHGPKAGAHDLRPGRGSRQEPFVPRPLAAELDGFSLHAAVRIPQGCREQLEKLHPDCQHAGPEMAAYRDDHARRAHLAR